MPVMNISPTAAQLARVVVESSPVQGLRVADLRPNGKFNRLITKIDKVIQTPGPVDQKQELDLEGDEYDLLRALWENFDLGQIVRNAVGLSAINQLDEAVNPSSPTS